MRKARASLAVAIATFICLATPVQAADSTTIEMPRDLLAASIGNSIKDGRKPVLLKVRVGEEEQNAHIYYNIDPELQGVVNDVMEHYNPDYTAAVALDPETGEVLVMTYSTRGKNPYGNLALHDGFPAASVFKVVTAAAAIDSDYLTKDSPMAYNGRSTTLYRKQVFEHNDNKWTSRPSLQLSFARSINPVFARIGTELLGPVQLADYAARFGFNRSFRSDLPIPTGKSFISLNDIWTVAEAASGYTRNTTLSPLHGAMIASVAVNDGKMVVPKLVSELITEDNRHISLSGEGSEEQVITTDTAAQLRELMRDTVRRGSARRYFKTFFKGENADIDVGGKTGTLSGANPKGLNDWFVGFAQYRGRKLAFAVVNTNVDKWYVKSATVSRKLIEAWADKIRSEARGVAMNKHDDSVTQ